MITFYVMIIKMKGGENMNQRILESSYGYDMTINNYYFIIKDGEKSALLQAIGRTICNDDGMGAGKSIADPSIIIGDPFRARKRIYPDSVMYVSKYIDGYSATIWDGKPSYYNTWD